MMLRPKQIVICVSLAVALWTLATIAIRLDPASVGSGLRGDVAFVASIPGSWLCIWLICRLARLEQHQILAGCMVVLGDCMLLDAIALRWFPTVYTVSDQIGRLGAAWLLWGYGSSAWLALFVADRRTRNSARGLAMQPIAN